MSVFVEIVGARDVAGRFARLHGELAVHLYERAAVMAGEIERRYREAAPKSDLGIGAYGDHRPSTFADSIHGVAMPSERGFEISVTTGQPDLARFLNEGTGPHPIDARNASVLANRDTGDVFGPHVNHPGSHKHDGWQDRVAEEVEPMAREEGNRIGAWVESRLGGKL